MTDPTPTDPAQPQPAAAQPAMPPPAVGTKDSIWMRALWMVIIAVMISMAQTLLFFATVLQFILMLTSQGRPNGQISAFGASLGNWLLKASRFQTAASEDKPWPWSPLS